MSLTANKERSSLSLGVELASDGSIVDSSIMATTSTIRVSYRLTYDDVDEMLEDGIAYSEEWELGALYSAALQRREYRISNGSAESFIPTQIPQFSMSTYRDSNAPSDTGIALKIQVSHNGGKNQSVVSAGSKDDDRIFAAPVSAASMLVTGTVFVEMLLRRTDNSRLTILATPFEEMMILAGEAMGKFKIREDDSMCVRGENGIQSLNSLRLPYRSQPKTGMLMQINKWNLRHGAVCLTLDIINRILLRL
eukprot:scaffold1378_cov137-Cylindrotheca_fusiformis.AAC.9